MYDLSLCFLEQRTLSSSTGMSRSDIDVRAFSQIFNSPYLNEQESNLKLLDKIIWDQYIQFPSTTQTRKGISSVVLEKSETLRTTGAAIGIFINGWNVLDQLGVGIKLRTKAIPLSEIRDVWLQENRTQVTPCRKETLRCLKRSDLVETFADNLPAESIRFGCQIAAVEMDPKTSFPVMHTNDGNVIKAKVLIGCDGSNSVVAKYLGLETAKTFKLLLIRGFTNYVAGHSYGSHFLRVRGHGIILGRIPVDDNLVHWFVGWQELRKDSEYQRDPKVIRDLALELVKKLPADVLEMVKNCDPGSLSLTQVRYRAPWHLRFSSMCKGSCTVAGDAMHVMGPFLGQGGSSGLEDAVVLARCLAKVICTSTEGKITDQELQKRVGMGLDKYLKERRWRVLRLSTQSFLIGSLIMVASSWIKKIVCIALLMAFFGGTSLSHTQYDCGRL